MHRGVNVPGNGMPNNGGSRTSRFRVGRARRGAEALELRLAGHSFAEIGRRMGVSGPRAYQLVAGELDRLNVRRFENAGELRRLEAARLDRLQAAVWDKALEGNLAAVDRALAIGARRARLLGLDLEPNTLSADRALALAGELAAAVRAEVNDPATLRRIQARLAALVHGGVVVDQEAPAPPAGLSEAGRPPRPVEARGEATAPPPQGLEAGNGEAVPYGLRELPQDDDPLEGNGP